MEVWKKAHIIGVHWRQWIIKYVCNIVVEEELNNQQRFGLVRGWVLYSNLLKLNRLQKLKLKPNWTTKPFKPKSNPTITKNSSSNQTRSIFKRFGFNSFMVWFQFSSQVKIPNWKFFLKISKLGLKMRRPLKEIFKKIFKKIIECQP